MKPKRKRGGQPGNKNALKHGFYSARLDPQEQADFRLAAGMEGVAEEIALLRCALKKAVTGGDVKNLAPLVNTAIALERLIRTHQQVFVAPSGTLEIAVRNVCQNVLVPLGVHINMYDDAGRRRLSAETDEDGPERKTIRPHSEADLTYNEKRLNEPD